MVVGTDTLNPLQREFIRLAQIFKARLVTELELAQRVKERALVEKRLDNRLEELKQQKLLEQKAEEALKAVRGEQQDARRNVLVAFQSVGAEVRRIIGEIQAPKTWSPTSISSCETIFLPIFARRYSSLTG